MLTLMARWCCKDDKSGQYANNKFSRKSGYVYAGKLDSSLMSYKEGVKKDHIPNNESKK
jgi:hypothetical protein